MTCQRRPAIAAPNLTLLHRGAAQIGVHLTPSMSSAFATYLRLLQDVGSTTNLTSVLDDDKIQTRHFLESIAVGVTLSHLGALSENSRLIDVGSGAGFPGLPIRIVWPQVQLTLLEASAKKAAFLQLVTDQLQLGNVTIVTERAETAARQPYLREHFDVVLARAVAPLPALAELTMPFARVGGVVAAVKGSRLERELIAARPAIAACGGDANAAQFQLHQLTEAATLRLVIMNKLHPTPARFPRRPGLPVKQPIS